MLLLYALVLGGGLALRAPHREPREKLSGSDPKPFEPSAFATKITRTGRYQPFVKVRKSLGLALVRSALVKRGILLDRRESSIIVL